MGTVDAALEAARLRFCPILMTSLAFILGITPLDFSVGAGVMGGMLRRRSSRSSSCRCSSS